MHLTDAQSWLLPLLQRRMTPQEIQEELGWSKTRYHTMLDQLAGLGLVRAFGEMPVGGSPSTYPSPECLDATALALPMLGWPSNWLGRIRRNEPRGGIMPPSPDGRYSRARWSGHAIRRVEWAQNDSTMVVVHGLLLPRSDGQMWHHRAPTTRVVAVSSDGFDDAPTLWAARRERIVPIGWVREHLPHAKLDELVAMTLAVAWVLESRALLDFEALVESTVLGEPK